ncbi:MAG: D-alanyl-D-alanine carboxypeptidase/D-alanyl-D-alanine-endopeptidase [Microbacteriaceae bacterium]|nr:D-alanyl-D-alanine carboxypeptidase/D-alanyl-D-alanine-endopeptidase [Microbacteriaceae bacterium]
MSDEKRGFAYLKQVLIGAGSGLLAIALIVVLTSFGGPAVPNPSNSSSETTTSSQTPSTTPTGARTCSVNDLALDPRLATFSGAVINAATGEVLFDRNAAVPAATASVMKVVTAAAALQALGPNFVVDTKVYADPANPGTIILVGGGDPTLSATAPGQKSVYANAPKLSDLAVKVSQWAEANSIQVNRIVLDSTLFAGGTSASKWDSSWERSEQTQGFMSEVTALQVDGDRASPSRETSPRSTTPVMNAGRKFKAALAATATGATLVEGKLPAGATEIAKVTSQTIDKWIKHMQQGYDGSFASIGIAVKKSLAATNLDTSNLIIKDGSGLSANNAVPPMFIAKLFGLVAEGFNDFEVIAQGLPVSGESGSLADRFKGDNADAIGKVQAKTGWIKTGYTLGGIIKAKDSTTLLFAVYALGNVKDDAKQAIDDLVTGFYRCGNTLSNQ